MRSTNSATSTPVTLLDRLLASGEEYLRLAMLSGDLRLARGHYADAMADFKRAELTQPRARAAIQGEGIALSLLGALR